MNREPRFECDECNFTSDSTIVWGEHRRRAHASMSYNVPLDERAPQPGRYDYADEHAGLDDDE